MSEWGGEGRYGVATKSRIQQSGNGQATHGRVAVTPSLVVIPMNIRFYE
jgi:hypothetical protein